MLTARDLLAAVRARQGIPSNYRLARLLDVPDTTVQRWNTGRNTPDDATAARLAELAGLDADATVASMHAQRAGSAPERSRWERIAERLQRAGVAACVILSLGFWSGGPDGGAYASTATTATPPKSAPVCILCQLIKRAFVTLCRRATANLSGFPPITA